MTIGLTPQQALDLLHSAVEKKGADYKYDNPDCVYAVYDEDVEAYVPSCIVGHVVAEEDEATLQDIVSQEFNEMVTVGDLADAGFLDADRQTRLILSVAQQTQDTRRTWGEAERVAQYAYENYDAVKDVYLDNIIDMALGSK